MTRDQLLAAFDRIRVWQRGDQRAVHKPLLVLLALARLARGEPPMVEFAALENKLKELLEEFGPSGSEATRHNPFWHLRTDGLWQLTGPDAILNRPPGATPTLTELRRDHFPDTIRQDVADAVGLNLEAASSSATQTPDQEETRRRDPAFREKVLLAYEYRCCVCGHDLRLGAHVIGLEAAHIKWFQARGPDVVPNGLSLCSLHHKIFDLGAFTVLPQNYQIVFSRHAIGGDATRAKLLAHHGAALIPPQSREYLPSAEFLDWHRKQVFKEPGRE